MQYCIVAFFNRPILEVNLMSDNVDQETIDRDKLLLDLMIHAYGLI